VKSYPHGGADGLFVHYREAPDPSNLKKIKKLRGGAFWISERRKLKERGRETTRRC